MSKQDDGPLDEGLEIWAGEVPGGVLKTFGPDKQAALEFARQNKNAQIWDMMSLNGKGNDGDPKKKA